MWMAPLPGGDAPPLYLRSENAIGENDAHLRGTADGPTGSLLSALVASVTPNSLIRSSFR